MRRQSWLLSARSAQEFGERGPAVAVVGAADVLVEAEAVAERGEDATKRMAGVTAQICGLGGIGKSLLAVEYANRVAAAWPGGIFWVEADPAWATPAQSAGSECHTAIWIGARRG
jgi:hypothetical protein